MKIALIGASGFVGTRLIEILKQQGEHTLLNIDKNQSRFYPEITTIADVRDKEKLKTLLQGQEMAVLLAAEHSDNVTPVSLYYDVNVEGARNVTEAMDVCGVTKIVFTSSMALYGMHPVSSSETQPANPFNHYGRSKWQAEEILRAWHSKNSVDKTLTIIRPTAIFGERNRGNVYNLLRQISTGRFLKVGNGNNRKSISYVGNVAAFIAWLLNNAQGYSVYNYSDKPDLSMNELITVVENALGKKIPAVKIPYTLGLLGGRCFDALAKITGKKFPVSSIRVRKFCSNSQLNADKLHATDFKAPFILEEGLSRTLQYEFVSQAKDDITFISE
ncbi:MAG: NAD-dependent epimerase/dehydratase family protein [Prevotella sp.]|jgi:nucleoside-diphosphate-sugar epimerase|nr:NAD-dependent epimerase/dehydratase family protein [Prevotella sp.]